MNNIDLGRAIKAPFADAEWVKKTLLGFVWVLLWVTLPAVYGAQLDYIRKVSAGDETLPEWDDFGGKWVQGFMVMLAGFLYFLPVAILFAVFMVPVIPVIITNGSGEALATVLGGSLCLYSIIAIVYAVVVSIFYSAALTNYAMSREFGAFFRFGEILGKVRGGTGYWNAWFYGIVISLVASTAMSVVSGITGGIGSILYPAVTYLMFMMMAHVLGQWARAAYNVAPAPSYAAPAPGGYPPPPPASLTPQQPYAPPAPPAAPGSYAPPAAPAAPEPSVPPVAPEAYAPPPQPAVEAVPLAAAEPAPSPAPPAPPAPPVEEPPTEEQQ